MDFKNSTIEEMNFNLINTTISVKETFVDLIQQNKISLYRLSKSILKNEADVEDAISETILKAYKSIDNLKSFDSFKPWLMKILVNECYSILKQHKKIELQEDFSACTGSYEDKHGDGLMVYLERLEENFKSVVILFYYEDLSIKDISKILKISEGTVKSRLSRAKAKLREIMN